MRDFAELLRTGPDTPGGRYMRLFWHPRKKTGPSASVAAPLVK
jgi:hypothetical protein